MLITKLEEVTKQGKILWRKLRPQGKSLIRIYSLKWVWWGWALIWVWLGGRGGGRLFEAGRLLTFSAFRVGAYSRWALIRGWALIRINTVTKKPNWPMPRGLNSFYSSDTTELTQDRFSFSSPVLFLSHDYKLILWDWREKFYYLVQTAHVSSRCKTYGGHGSELQPPSTKYSKPPFLFPLVPGTYSGSLSTQTKSFWFGWL